MPFATRRDGLWMGALRPLASLFPPYERWLSWLRLAHDHRAIELIRCGLVWAVLGFRHDNDPPSSMLSRDFATPRYTSPDRGARSWIWILGLGSCVSHPYTTPHSGFAIRITLAPELCVYEERLDLLFHLKYDSN